MFIDLIILWVKSCNRCNVFYFVKQINNSIFRTNSMYTFYVRCCYFVLDKEFAINFFSLPINRETESRCLCGQIRFLGICPPVVTSSQHFILCTLRNATCAHCRSLSVVDGTDAATMTTVTLSRTTTKGF